MKRNGVWLVVCAVFCVVLMGALLICGSFLSVYAYIIATAPRHLYITELYPEAQGYWETAPRHMLPTSIANEQIPIPPVFPPVPAQGSTWETTYFEHTPHYTYTIKTVRYGALSWLMLYLEQRGSDSKAYGTLQWYTMSNERHMWEVVWVKTKRAIGGISIYSHSSTPLATEKKCWGNTKLLENNDATKALDTLRTLATDKYCAYVQQQLQRTLGRWNARTIHP